ATDPAVVTSKPRLSSARPSRVRRALSSSSSRSVLSGRAAIRASVSGIIVLLGLKSVTAPLRSRFIRSGATSRRRNLQGGPGPAHGDPGALRLALAAVARSDRDLAAGPLQQGAGDEEAQPRAALTGGDGLRLGRGLAVPAVLAALAARRGGGDRGGDLGG